MRPLSDEGHRIVSEIAQRHGVSTAAVAHLLVAVMAGNGTQAQFNHQDLGGMGQWSQGGMTMVGDMFNNGLKAKVDALCTELAALIRNSDLLAPAPGSHQSQSQGSGSYQDDGYLGSQSQGVQYQGQQQGGSYQGGTSSGGGVSLFVPGSGQAASGWPAELGQPASTGAQNNLRYAFFPAMRRLLIDHGGRITVYDTRDHQIGGFSQQQGGDQSLTFTSQYGLVRVADLEIVSPAEDRASDAPPPSIAFEAQPPALHHAPAPVEPAAAPAWTPPPPAAYAPPYRAEPRASDDDIIDKIERLAGLRAKGILTDAEFEAKKTDLLSRL